MSGEYFNFSQEQKDRERSQNIGAETLAQMPAFSEHMKSFSEAKQNGEVPDGVRDEQDYREYAQEKEARLNEAKDLIWNTYHFEDSPHSAKSSERIMKFLASEDLKTVVESGFSLEDMFKNGILSKTDGRYIDNYIPELAKIMAFSDAKKIIENLADFCETVTSKNNSDILFNKMQDIFDAWSDNNLDAGQYEMISDWLTPNSVLRNRLMYGETIDENGESTSSLNQVNHTLHLIDTLQEIEEKYGASGIALDLYTDKIKTRPNEIDYYVHNDMKSAFGEAAHKIFDCFLNESDHDITARVIIKSVITPNDFDLIKKAKEVTDYWDEPIFSDEELLSSIYNIDPSNKTEKLYGRKEIGNKLPRHFAVLEEAGFSRDSLLNIIHDKNVPVHAEEVERMREAGVSNADIAYASRAYERFVVNEDGEKDWFDPINNDFFAREKDEYDPAFGLSDTDILNAANRSYWRNERLAKNTSEE